MWYLDYEKRFNALPEFEKKLSPEWTEEMASKETAAYRAQAKSGTYPDSATADVFRALDVDKKTSSAEQIAPFTGSNEDLDDASRGVVSTDAAGSERPMSATLTTGTTMSSKTMYSQKSGAAFQNAGLKWQPCKNSPSHYARPLSNSLTDPFAQSPCSPIAKKCPESSPYISPTSLPASSISRLAMSLRPCTLWNSQPIPQPFAT